MADEPPLEYPAAAAARSDSRTWRILFIDSADHIEELKTCGKDAGYVVVGAATLDEAWAFLDGQDHADVIVCAAHLPEESVFDLLTAVRANPLHQHARFLILSLEPGERAARLDPSTERAGRALGADDYLVLAQFDATLLITTIHRLRPATPLLQQAESGAAKPVGGGRDP